MATGWVQSIEILPAREVGKMQVVAPCSRTVLQEDTEANIAAWLHAEFPQMFTSLTFAEEIVRRGKEIRGVIKGVGYINQPDTIPV